MKTSQTQSPMETITYRQRLTTAYLSLAEREWSRLADAGVAGIAHLRNDHLHYADLWMRMIIAATALPEESKDLLPPLV